VCCGVLRCAAVCCGVLRCGDIDHPPLTGGKQAIESS